MKNLLQSTAHYFKTELKPKNLAQHLPERQAFYWYNNLIKHKSKDV